jgi:hypothetical protein
LFHCLSIDIDDETLLRQMYQFFISSDLQEDSHAALPVRFLALRAKCRATFIWFSVQSSASK